MSLRNLLRFATLSGALLAALAGNGRDAEAQQRVLPAKAKATAPVQLTGAARFKPTNISAPLKSALRGKTLMVTPKSKAGAYAREMKNSVEVMFQPNASSYGHILVRVGERIYDMPGPGGARNQHFVDAMQRVHSPAYGFVYARSSQQIATLQRGFEEFANAGHGFSVAGVGPTKFSCAGFVTAALRQHAPDLEVGLSAGAISAASHLLRNGKYDAITLYGTAAEQAGHADFKFLKLQ